MLLHIGLIGRNMQRCAQFGCGGAKLALLFQNTAQLIVQHKPSSDMEKIAIRDGMLLMKQDGYLKVLDGLTTIEEVLRVAQI
jgi:type II secretory ATPase GspE/PulE/Tfp pilus assembly ATPase PilB-like protein